MNHLNNAIQEAFNASGNTKEANKAYIEFIKANFIIPVEKDEEGEEPRVLFLQEKEHYFLPVFTELSYLNAWASDISHEIQVLRLSGVDLLKGLEEQVTVALDIGSPYYKAFNPSEIARMKSLVLKFFNK